MQRRAAPTSEATTLPGGSPLFAPVADDSNKVLLEAMSPLQVGCLAACSATCDELHVYPLTVLTAHSTGLCWGAFNVYHFAPYLGWWDAADVAQREQTHGAAVPRHLRPVPYILCSLLQPVDTAELLCSQVVKLGLEAAQ